MLVQVEGDVKFEAYVNRFTRMGRREQIEKWKIVRIVGLDGILMREAGRGSSAFAGFNCCCDIFCNSFICSLWFSTSLLLQFQYGSSTL